MIVLSTSQGRGGEGLLSLSGFTAVISPCGAVVGTRRGFGAGVLTLVGVVMLYVAIAFAGCMSRVPPRDSGRSLEDRRGKTRARFSPSRVLAARDVGDVHCVGRAILLARAG
jgi:hypothetical protein